MIPASSGESGIKDYGRRMPPGRTLARGLGRRRVRARSDAADAVCGAAGFDGTQFKGLLAERFDIQINKTSRNSVLIQTNINNTRSDAALLIKALADLSREIEQRLNQGGQAERAQFVPRARR